MAIKTNMELMTIGDKIICKYVSTVANTVGTFSELGISTSTAISVSPPTTPNGSFYFYYVGDDHLGRKIFVSDRNIQSGISWDIINSSGIASGKGLPVTINDISFYTIRLLTGGTITTDVDCEWDKYIVKSTLNGTITAGSNTIWNWSGITSATSTRAVTTLGRSVGRGNTIVTTFLESATTATGGQGFRPVLIYDNQVQKKYLVQDGTAIKKYTGTWVQVGTAPASKAMFDTDGMLGLLGIDNTSIQLLTSTTPEILNWTSATNIINDVSIITPMTSNVLPSPFVATSSSKFNTAYEPYNVFNGITSNVVNSEWLTPSGTTTGWVKIDLGTARIAKKYSVVGSTGWGSADILSAPKNWTLQGSNTGSFAGEETILDTQTNQIYSSFAEIKIFTFSNSTGYRYYRINITANNGSTSFLTVGELILLEIEELSLSKTLNMNAIPNPRVITQNSPLVLAGALQSLNFSATESGSGKARIIISPDNGVTWYYGSPVYGSNSTTTLIPQMTSNTSANSLGFFVTSSSIYGASWDLWMAFDRGLTNTFLFASNAPEWLKIDIGEANVHNIIGGYAISFCDNAGNAVLASGLKTWTFEGSNTGAFAGEQTILDTQTNVAVWTVSLKRTYNFTNSTQYRYYRLNVTANQGNASYTSIGEFEIYPKSITGISWNSVLITDLTTIKNSLSNSVIINLATTANLATLSPTNSFRIGYYLDITATTDVAKINRLLVNELASTLTPTVSALSVLYNAIDSNYYGLIFTDMSNNYYSTSLGAVLQYLNFGTIIAGQTSGEFQVKLKNFLNFSVQNIEISSYNLLSNITIEFSKTTSPFIASSLLTFATPVVADDFVTFYVRVVTTSSTLVGGNFDVKVKADPA